MELTTITAGAVGIVTITGGVIGVIKAIKGLVKREVERKVEKKVDKDDFTHLRQQNDQCHSEMKQSLAVGATKMDGMAKIQDQVLQAVLRIEKSNGGGGDG